jgi:2-polyprenyl-3-methyl-5-hydroxy-6-metoxy-1,4-benzoquinol methylase
MTQDPQAKYASRHQDVDRDAFYAGARRDMNTAVDQYGHHPHLSYTPAAFRHYTRRLALLDRLASLKFESALDVGCAEGYFMAAIAAQRGTEMWGVDLSDRAVSVAASRYGFSVAAAQATALPFADGAFDLVYSTEVIEHILDPTVMLAEMRRVSRGHVLVTTPVSQSDDEHPPDYEIRDNGHVNDFDESSMRLLFGPEADLRTFRCNATFAAVAAFGRKLPPRPRDAFYRLDHRVAKRFGAPHRRFVPLRNRDWLIVAPGGASQAGPREWRCPHCRGELVAAPEALRCPVDRVSYPLAAPGVPDFVGSR